MTETAHRKRGGKAFHSILESHFDFIHQLRQRRKTWQEIAGLLSTEKGVRVTLYAPYRFYRRQLRRHAKGHWEGQASQPANSPASPPQTASRPQSRPAPLPPNPDFKRPDLSKFNMDHFT
jgi:hypothetical protein